MSGLRRARGRSERGATLVEAAFALPIFLVLIFGMIEFGYSEFLDSQSSSAARDGARVGILTPDDEPAIEAAVRARLVGLDPDDITVTCLEGFSDSPRVVIDCADAEANTDRIEVQVTTSRSPLTPVGLLFGTRELEATARMVITGLPVGVTTPPLVTTTTTSPPASTTTSTTTTTTPPGGCQVTSVLPRDTITFGNGSNADSYTARATTIDVVASTNCTGLRIEFPNGPAAGTYTSVALSPTGTPGQLTASLPRFAYSVPVGTHTIRVVDAGGSVLHASLTITRS
jgi:Flp pilus assembly protein TadG